MADDDNHARQRRALSHSFSQKALEEQEYIVKRYVDQLVENMRRMATNDEQFNLVRTGIALSICGFKLTLDR
jgi:cytochrome P450